MKNGLIHGQLLEYPIESYWFNNQEYIEFNNRQTVQTFSFQEEEGSGFISFVAEADNKSWLSPCRAPFGGFECSPGVSPGLLFEFVKACVEEAKKQKIKAIKIVMPPECYSFEMADLTDEVLLHAGFKVQTMDLNFHIPISEESFASFIHDSENRRLRKAQQEGFSFQKEIHPDYKSIHQLIVDCRERKGYPLSMNLEDFERAISNFPNQYLVFTVKDNQKIIAAAIGVNVGKKILYNFLPADHKDYLNFSPMVLLHHGIYNYCQQHHYLIYDLGIATANGIRNEGLIKFKEHLGGKLSHKYTYILNL